MTKFTMAPARVAPKTPIVPAELSERVILVPTDISSPAKNLTVK